MDALTSLATNLSRALVYAATISRWAARLGGGIIGTAALLLMILIRIGIPVAGALLILALSLEVSINQLYLAALTQAFDSTTNFCSCELQELMRLHNNY